MGDAHGGRQRNQAFLYLFAHPPDGSSGESPAAAHHSSELPFAFRVEHSGEGPDGGAFYRFNVSRERPLADAFASALVTFAATGAPPPNWPPYHHTAEQSWMVFGATSGRKLTGSAVSGLRRAECALWDATASARKGKEDGSALAHAVQTIHMDMDSTSDPSLLDGSELDIPDLSLLWGQAPLFKRQK